MHQQLKLDQRVKAKSDLYEFANEDHPTFKYASKDDILVIRAINRCAYYGLHVSHENVTDRSFKCSEDEVILIN